MQGTVVKSTGSWYNVKSDDDAIVQCRIKGKFRIKGIKSTNPIAVGDLVEYDIDDDGYGVIHKIHPRKNYIIRKSTKLSKQVHIIASNIDQLVLVTTIVQPKIALGFVDRILATAEAYSIPATIVFNKFDLYDDEAIDKLAGILAIYDPIGYNYCLTSVKTKKGLSEFSELLKGKTSLLSGHSGVGKSSLINAIEPDLDLKVKDVSGYNEKGQHTTTFAELHPLSIGGNIIDTPGVRSFGIIDFEKEHLSHYFPEMKALMGQCKFHNCVHVNEPQCAVKAAVEEGEIAFSRYENYLNMYHDENLDKNY
ncbi:MAG: ribosome small subunit-dependent GTPase A [Crocinitomicaceae bacterium]|nr:ribosome small subunit-dependent GTPase A [Crocinitomicaceae bacterium]|tara:strand:+ start:5188 stop:6111 length:924 start_codon:yes stop_codon:yes gene_type:complete